MDPRESDSHSSCGPRVSAGLDCFLEKGCSHREKRGFGIILDTHGKYITLYVCIVTIVSEVGVGQER